MAKRTGKQQSKHDQKVASLARQLKTAGWNVHADIPGYPRPATIGNTLPRRPDVVATKQGHTRIIEVETPDTMTTDKKQHEVFRRHAGQKGNTKFEISLSD